jgi:hypothetical protein
MACSRLCNRGRLRASSDMARRMRDKAFRDDQWARRYTGPVAPINRFIDDLGAKDQAGHPPYTTSSFPISGETSPRASDQW